jgi:hypothetical protein
MKWEYFWAGVVNLIGMTPYAGAVMQWLWPSGLEAIVDLGKFLKFPDGFFGYVILALFTGWITWLATKAGVTAAFRMEQESKEKDRIRSKVNLVVQLVDELEIAIKEVERIKMGKSMSMSATFPAFAATIDLQVQYFIATGPAFMKMIHRYFDKLREKVEKLKSNLNLTGSEKTETEPPQKSSELIHDAEETLVLLNELVFMLRNEVSDREVRIFNEIKVEDQQRRDKERLRAFVSIDDRKSK